MQLVESFSSACGFGMSLHPATPMPRTTQKAAAMLAMKYAIGKNCFPVLRTRVLGWWAAGDHLLRSLSQVRAEGTRSRLAMKDSIGQKNPKWRESFVHAFFWRSPLPRLITFCSNRVQCPGGPNRRRGLRQAHIRSKLVLPTARAEGSYQ